MGWFNHQPVLEEYNKMLGVYTETYPCRPESMVFRSAKVELDHAHEDTKDTHGCVEQAPKDCDGVLGLQSYAVGFFHFYYQSNNYIIKHLPTAASERLRGA